MIQLFQRTELLDNLDYTNTDLVKRLLLVFNDIEYLVHQGEESILYLYVDLKKAISHLETGEYEKFLRKPDSTYSLTVVEKVQTYLGE